MPEYDPQGLTANDPTRVATMPGGSGQSGETTPNITRIFDPEGLTANDPLYVATMPVQGPLTTCPLVIGPTRLKIVSSLCFSGDGLFEIRQGDTQPALSFQVLDFYGAPLILVGATVTACFVVPGQTSYVAVYEMSVGEDQITANYSRQLTDFITQTPGRYFFVVTVRYPDGTGISAPNDGAAVCRVNSQWW